MTRNKISTKRVVGFLYEIGTLRKTARSHRQILLSNDLSDNIASHSYRVTLIGYVLAIMENVNVEKVIKMCLLHDADETRSNDQNWIHKKYVKVFEEEIINDQLSFFGDEFTKIKNEYNKRISPESRITKDADILDQILILNEYALTGNKEAQKWLKRKNESYLSTRSARKLYKEIKSQSPSAWWDKIWTEKRR